MNFDVHSPTAHTLFVRDRPIGAYLVFVDIPYITPIALAFLTPETTVKSSDSQVLLPDQRLPSLWGKSRPPLGPNGFANAGFCQ